MIDVNPEIDSFIQVIDASSELRVPCGV